MAGKQLFIDSNVLVYANHISSPFCEAARKKLLSFTETYDGYWISRQVIREYLVVMSNIMLATGKVDYLALESDINNFLQSYQVADEVGGVTTELMGLIGKTSTAGKTIHDANIVAVMLFNDIDTLLTNNIADFRRFSNLIHIEPLV